MQREIANLGNEAGLLRKELSDVRAELRKALEENRVLRDQLLAQSLQACNREILENMRRNQG